MTPDQAADQAGRGWAAVAAMVLLAWLGYACAGQAIKVLPRGDKAAGAMWCAAALACYALFLAAGALAFFSFFT